MYIYIYIYIYIPFPEVMLFSLQVAAMFTRCEGIRWHYDKFN